MKWYRWVAVLLISAMLFLFAACDRQEPEEPSLAPGESEQLVLIVPGGKVADSPTAKAALDALNTYGVKKGLRVHTYAAKSESNQALCDAITKAADRQAQLIVCPGAVFEQAVYQLQNLYPQVRFLLIGGTPNDGGAKAQTKAEETASGQATTTSTSASKQPTASENAAGTTRTPASKSTQSTSGGQSTASTTPLPADIPEPEQAQKIYKTGKNVFCLTIAAGQSGYLAGYLSVMDGKRVLGFLGGCSCDQERQALAGFYQGAADAAKELELEQGAVSLRYAFTGTQRPSSKAQALATGWYKSGVQVIFSDSNAQNQSVMRAAESQNGYLIGSVTDQSFSSVRVLTSTVYDIASGMERVLKKAGSTGSSSWTETLSVTDDGISIAMRTSLFAQMHTDDYAKARTKLLAKSSAVMPNPQLAAAENELVLLRYVPFSA